MSQTTYATTSRRVSQNVVRWGKILWTRTASRISSPAMTEVSVASSSR